MISKENQIKRLNFAKAHIHWTAQQWKNVLWSDESKFNLIGSDGNQRVRRTNNARLLKKYCKKTVKHGGGSIMI